MKSLSMTMALLLLSPAVPLASAQTSADQAFVSGGRIEMQLEAGGYEIKPSADNAIHVHFGGNIGNARVTVNVNGTHADLHISNTPNNNFQATIEVPATSDLKVRLTAGDLQIGPITGNKEIELRAGNLSVKIPNPDDYARVEAHVRAGDLDASAFGHSTGGLLRSFTWMGKGKYTLRASLLAGDLNLRK